MHCCPDNGPASLVRLAAASLSASRALYEPTKLITVWWRAGGGQHDPRREQHAQKGRRENKSVGNAVFSHCIRVVCHNKT